MVDYYVLTVYQLSGVRACWHDSDVCVCMRWNDCQFPPPPPPRPGEAGGDEDGDGGEGGEEGDDGEGGEGGEDGGAGGGGGRKYVTAIVYTV